MILRTALRNIWHFGLSIAWTSWWYLYGLSCERYFRQKVCSKQVELKPLDHC